MYKRVKRDQRTGDPVGNRLEQERQIAVTPHRLSALFGEADNFMFSSCVFDFTNEDRSEYYSLQIDRADKTSNRVYLAELWTFKHTTDDQVDIFKNWLTRKMDGESDESIAVFASASGAIEPEPETKIPGLTFERVAFYNSPVNPGRLFYAASAYAMATGNLWAALLVNSVAQALDEDGDELTPEERELRDLVSKLDAIDIDYLIVTRKTLK